MPNLTGFGFPWGTLIVNVTGSFLIGFTVRYLDAVSVTPEVRALLTIGFLGAFTTFSAYSLESLALVRGGDWGRAAIYSGGSVLLGVAAVGCGLATAAMVLRGTGNP